jgi:formylglycine-generating enzyme required for sulfatase activity
MIISKYSLDRLLVAICICGMALSALFGSGVVAAEPDASPDAAMRYLRAFNTTALQLAITDLSENYPDRYPKGNVYLARLNELDSERLLALSAGNDVSGTRLQQLAGNLKQLKTDALLANPLLDVEQLLVVKRRAAPAKWNPNKRQKSAVDIKGGGFNTVQFDPIDGKELGLPVNHNSLWSLPPDQYDNEIAVLKPVRPNGKLTTLYKPDGKQYVGEVDLHWNADRLLFSQREDERFQVFEMNIDGGGKRRVTPNDQPDVDNYDAVYLPGGQIIFCSTANYQSVPCWNGLHVVAGLYRLEIDGKTVRQLTFDQDDDNYPVVLNSGQVLYTRWEYANIPHYFGRLLFQMNPDGTAQRGIYGSNSYWPNAIYYAQAVPGHSTKIAGIVSGHHGNHRMGELVIFDPATGRTGADGVVQRIPGRGASVKPELRDNAVDKSWPKFLHPKPLSENYFIVSAKPRRDANWGIYLVDTFDNMELLYEADGYALVEPVVVKKTSVPPVIPERVDLAQKEGVVYMQNVYEGPGLAGVPKGTVKNLRVYAYHWGYRGVSGFDKIGIDGSWDVMRILGTVPVHEDGSAYFHAPANTPIAVQPLDDKNRALQVMRSWFTVMPGEVRSCVGCHEKQNTAPITGATQAQRQGVVDITPWYGPARGFDFAREVQPVLDQYCVSCHDGSNDKTKRPMPDLRPAHQVPDYKGIMTNVPKWYAEGKCPSDWKPNMQRTGQRQHAPILFTPAYEALHPFTRRAGLEGDYVMSETAEYHANTSPLIQLLEKGHHNVQLDSEAWDRLTTWIDLNIPCHGTWSEVMPVPFSGVQRRNELSKLYANVDVNYEAVPEITCEPEPAVIPEPLPPASGATCYGWPFDEFDAAERQRAAGRVTEQTIEIDRDIELRLSLIPSGAFVMGDPQGAMDERQTGVATIEEPFWMATTEVTNAMYRLFDSEHDSRYINRFGTDTNTRGYAVNHPKQPVVRVTWQEAMEFCDWLSEKTGKTFTLPTEAQWEWACRAGSDEAFGFGDADVSFHQWANLADISMAKFWIGEDGPLQMVQPAWMIRRNDVNDRVQVTSPIGKYRPNVWGLYDMHGNAAEWTRTSYASYPYNAADGRDALGSRGNKVVRGGSWYDMPYRAQSATRQQYPAWQPVFNVGFRVVLKWSNVEATKE